MQTGRLRAGANPVAPWQPLREGRRPVAEQQFRLRIHLRRWLLPLLLLLPVPACAIEVTDDAGHHVQLAMSATRVVSLAPHLTEMVYAMDAGARLIAADEFSNYPAAARELPRIGAAGQFSAERILALQPDLVLAWQSGLPPRTEAALRSFGVPLFISEPRRLADVAANLEALGLLLGAGNAAVVARAYRAELARLQARYQQREPVAVFYQVWMKPLLTINAQHVLGEALKLCGARQLFADVPVLTPRVGLEAVVTAGPQLVLFAAPPEQQDRWQQFWHTVPGMQAVPVRALNPDFVSRPGPRILLGVGQMCDAVDTVRVRAPTEEPS